MSIETHTSFDDETRNEFTEMGIDADAIEELVIEISAAESARYERIKEAVASNDVSKLEDDDVFIALNMLRSAFDISSPEAKKQFLKSIRGNDQE